MRFFAIPRTLRHQGERDEQITLRRRQAWIAALARKKEELTEKTLNHLLVCEQHFVSGMYIVYVHNK